MDNYLQIKTKKTEQHFTDGESSTKFYSLCPLKIEIFETTRILMQDW